MNAASYIDSLAASARCAAGDWKICGRPLVPFSLAHVAIFDALELPVWITGNVSDLSEWTQLAVLCSQPACVALAELSRIQSMPEEERAAHVATLMLAFDAERDPVAWGEYLAACFGARPRIRQSPDREDGEGEVLRAPFSEYIAAFIMSKTSGYTRRELVEEMPASLVFWIHETICEQQFGSRIVTEEEAAEEARLQSPEGEAETAQMEATANEIDAHFQANDALRLKLLGKLVAGTLPKNWRTIKWKGVERRAK
jgi:hypothetical protein